MLESLKETFQMLANFFSPKEIDCVESVKPDKGAPFYNHILIADRGLNTFRVTLEEFVDEQHIDTRLIFKAIDLTPSEALDIVNAFDRISGTPDEESKAYRLKDSADVEYQATKYADINSYDELLSAIEQLDGRQLVYLQKNQENAAKAALTRSLS